MTKEIKFRAWDKELKILHPVQDLQFGNNGKTHVFLALGEDVCSEGFAPEKFDLMQYTGLKDKNGKEIYEGDIVQRIFQERAYQKCEVKFEDGTFGIEDYDQAGISSLWALRGRSHHFMIIGNIFENPELLEAKND